jgi:hypothetical protein
MVKRMDDKSRLLKVALPRAIRAAHLQEEVVRLKEAASQARQTSLEKEVADLRSALQGEGNFVDMSALCPACKAYLLPLF